MRRVEGIVESADVSSKLLESGGSSVVYVLVKQSDAS